MTARVLYSLQRLPTGDYLVTDFTGDDMPKTATLDRAAFRDFLKDTAANGNARDRVHARRLLRNERLFDRAAGHTELMATQDGIAAAPPGGWVQWLIDNAPKILALVATIIKRFG